MKDFAKAVIYLCLGAMAVWLITVVPDLQVLDPKGEISATVFFKSLWSLIRLWADHAYDRITGQPVRSMALSFGIAAAISGITLLTRFGRRIVMFFRETGRRKILLNRVGMEAFLSDADPATDFGKAMWAEIVAEITSPENSILYILGATGWETFGSKPSPLHDAIAKFNGTTHIILMDPACEDVEGRATGLKMTKKGYVNQIRKSIDYLKDLVAQGKIVEAKQYHSPPNWKIVLTSRKAWIQYYLAHQHVSKTPVYVLYSTEDQLGLYHAFHANFGRIWSRCAPIDLRLPKKQAPARRAPGWGAISVQPFSAHNPKP